MLAIITVLNPLAVSRMYLLDVLKLCLGPTRYDHYNKLKLC